MPPDPGQHMHLYLPEPLLTLVTELLFRGPTVSLLHASENGGNPAPCRRGSVPVLLCELHGKQRIPKCSCSLQGRAPGGGKGKPALQVAWTAHGQTPPPSLRSSRKPPALGENPASGTPT